MDRFIGIASLVFALSLYSAAQDTNDGSKAITKPVPFPTATETPGPPTNKPTPSPTHGSVRRPARVATGLKYWVELVQPGNPQLLRVNATRIFHSGERIRLHLQSNVGGRIMLFQLNPDGTSQLLFPDRRLNNGDNHILAGTDTAIPAGNAWLTFDNHPAVERLMVFLESDPEPSVDPQTSETRPGTQQQTGFPDAIQASPEGRIDPDKTASLVAELDKQKGDKSLKLEVDNTSDAPAGYAVKTGAEQKGKSGRETLAIEIPLKHQ